MITYKHLNILRTKSGRRLAAELGVSHSTVNKWVHKLRKETVLAFSCTHFPFNHPEYLDFLEYLYHTYKCTKVVHLGDFSDQYAPSQYDKHPDIISGTEELTETHKAAKKFFEVFPEGHLCLGNHDKRLIKALQKVNVSSVFLKSFRDIYTIPDAWTITNEVEIDGVQYFHGEGKSGIYAPKQWVESLHKSCITGHLHYSAMIYYAGNSGLFGANTGCLVDQDSLAMEYGQAIKKGPALGANIIFNGKSVSHFAL